MTHGRCRTAGWARIRGRPPARPTALPPHGRVNEVLREVLAEEIELVASPTPVSSWSRSPPSAASRTCAMPPSSWRRCPIRPGKRWARPGPACRRPSPARSGMKRTPSCPFEADPAVGHGERVEDILRAFTPSEGAEDAGAAAGGAVGQAGTAGRADACAPSARAVCDRRRGRRVTGGEGGPGRRRARARGVSPVDGLLVIDKPAGCTSHDVVARCRRIFGQSKVGHAGTLDPDATGVLLVGWARPRGCCGSSPAGQALLGRGGARRGHLHP